MSTDLAPYEAAAVFSPETPAVGPLSVEEDVTLQSGERPDVPAALVKVLGTTLEGDIADLADLATPTGATDEVAELTRRSVQQRPGFTLRGGTSEVLRGVIARGLGMR